MTYRPEVDGLRTVAVLSVLFFHAEFSLFSGGFIGVDIFFVISGYLITNVISKEIQFNNFTFISFYERRIRRIFPALFFVIFCSIPPALYLMTQVDLKHFWQSLFASTIFGSNVLFWFQSGNYFDTASIWKPLHHTWSLAVEEQFYFFHPIIMMFFFRYGLRLQKYIVLLGIILSLSYSFYLINIDPKGNFYLLPSRVWELYFGTFLAFIDTGRVKSFFSNKFNDFFALTGLILISYSILTFNSFTAHPSLLTVIPVFGTALIILFSSKFGLSGFILTNKPVVYIGLISYSLYLWHYPVFVFFRLIITKDLTNFHYIILIIFSFILSIISYYYIEKPFRDKEKFKRKSIFVLYSFVSVVFLLIGYMGHLEVNFQISDTNQKVQNINLVQKIGMEDLDGCHGRSVNDLCLIGNKAKNPTWALIGDSHAGSLSSELSRAFSIKGLSGIQLSQGGCGYVLGLNKSFLNPTFCEDLNKEIEKVILNDRIRNIIISARYVRYLYKEGYDNGEGGKESNLEDTFYYPNSYNTEKERMDKVLFAYKISIEKLLLSGKNIYMVYPVPEIGYDVVRQSNKPFNRNSKVTISYQSYLNRSKPVIETFDKLLVYDNFVKIDPSKLFCNILTSGRCETSIDNKLLYFDDDHVSNHGAKLIVNNILNYKFNK